MSDKEPTEEELFYKGFIEDSPLVSPNEDQVKARIKGYLKKLHKDEVTELEKFETALNHSLLEIDQLQKIVINNSSFSMLMYSWQTQVSN